MESPRSWKRTQVVADAEAELWRINVLEMLDIAYASARDNEPRYAVFAKGGWQTDRTMGLA